jgi:ADP-ribose pyrophosphatase YjhB (NUDIX family)
LPGVGALIFRGSGAARRILLVERGGQPLKGYWSLPGGLVETGERLEEAVRREVLEETGLRVKPTHLFGIYERIMPGADGRIEYHYLLLDYVCKVISGAIQAADDASSVRWVRQSELDAYKLTGGTREVIEQAFLEGGQKKRPALRVPLHAIQLA